MLICSTSSLSPLIRLFPSILRVACLSGSFLYPTLSYADETLIQAGGSVFVIAVMAILLVILAVAFYVSLKSISDLKVSLDHTKQSELNFKRSEEKYALAFHASPDAVLIVRYSDMQILDVNEGFERFIGYCQKEAVGKTTLDLDLWQDLMRRDVLLKHVVEHGEANGWEMGIVSKELSGQADGKTISMLLKKKMM